MGSRARTAEALGNASGKAYAGAMSPAPKQAKLTAILARASALALASACGDEPLAARAEADAGTQAHELDFDAVSQLDAQEDRQAPEDIARLGLHEVSLPEVSESSGLDTASTPLDAGQVWTPLIAARPYGFRLPVQYDPAKAWPLVILLHGYVESAPFIDGWLKIGDEVDSQSFLLAVPEGTKDQTGVRYWNATNACCDLFANKVDDVGYLKAVIADMKWKFHVDPKRVYVMGHSNGAFMAHRLACEMADQIAGIVALSGVNYAEASACKPSAPVSVLQVHGTLDPVIAYLGGILPGGVYPSAKASTSAWAARNGCQEKPSADKNLDLDLLVPFAETTVQRWSGCKGGAAELWTTWGGDHFLKPKKDVAARLIGWLQGHPKP